MIANTGSLGIAPGQPHGGAKRPHAKARLQGPVSHWCLLASELHVDLAELKNVSTTDTARSPTTWSNVRFLHTDQLYRRRHINRYRQTGANAMWSGVDALQRFAEPLRSRSHYHYRQLLSSPSLSWGGAPFNLSRWTSLVKRTGPGSSKRVALCKSTWAKATCKKVVSSRKP